MPATSTRLKKPSIWRQLGITLVLVAVQVYFGVGAVTGQFGIISQHQMERDIVALNAQSATLGAEISTLQHRISLFNPKKLDPDILSERARELLSMAEPDELLIMTGPNWVSKDKVKLAY